MHGVRAFCFLCDLWIVTEITSREADESENSEAEQISHRDYRLNS